MTHLAFVLPGMDRVGGAERQVVELARGLARRGWRVSLICLSGGGGAVGSAVAEAGIEVVALEMRKGVVDPRGWIRLQRWIRARRPDILHAHLPHGSWMARGVRLLAPVRVVVDTMHTAAALPTVRRSAYRVTRGLSDCVTAVGEDVAAACRTHGIANGKELAVIPNGIDTAAWKPDANARRWARGELGIGEGFVWCTVGRLEPVKDHELLLEAFAGLPDGAHLLIAGAGRLEQGLRAQARGLGIEGRVRFLGFQADPRRWLQPSDGFVLSSRWEGLPVSLLEAGACGLPCVATDVAGVREIVEHGVTGLVARGRDEGALREAMLRLMSVEEEERAAMGQRARRRIEGRFGLEAVLDEWETLYGDLLARRPEPTRFSVVREW